MTLPCAFVANEANEVAVEVERMVQPVDCMVTSWCCKCVVGAFLQDHKLAHKRAQIQHSKLELSTSESTTKRCTAVVVDHTASCETPLGAANIPFSGESSKSLAP